MDTRAFCEHFVEAVGKEAGPWLFTSTRSFLALNSPGRATVEFRPCANDRADACFEIEPQCRISRWAFAHWQGRFRRVP